jgi:hypothetical protein
MNLQNEQAEKPISATSGKFCDGSGFQGDVRFRDYIDALHVGDLDKCGDMRDRYSQDHQAIAKFNCVERIWLTEMARYVREVQICQREVAAYKAIADGKTDKGDAMFDQVRAARLEHESPTIPNGFEMV